MTRHDYSATISAGITTQEAIDKVSRVAKRRTKGFTGASRQTGDTFTVRFGDRSVPEWVNTELEFRVVRQSDWSILRFRHSRRREDAEMFPECSMHWAIYLLSLKEFVETGNGRPHPYDMPVNVVAGCKAPSACEAKDRRHRLFRVE